MISPFSLDTFLVPSPAEYTRYSRSHEWQHYFGKRGKIYSVASVNHPSASSEYPVKAPARFELVAPYQIAIVEFPDGGRRTFMVMSGEKMEIGDEAECVVGAHPADTDEGIIPYKIKVRHPVSSTPMAPLRLAKQPQ